MINSLNDRVEVALGTNNINKALCLIHDFVERIITEPICTAKVFSSLQLDQLCLRIGRHSLANLDILPAASPPECEVNPTIIYIVSRLQKSGGHSRLVQDFIRAQPEKNHLILSTEVGGESDTRFFSELFADTDNISFVRAKAESFEARLKWLQSTLLSVRPIHVYLFNHHQDSTAVAAFVPELELTGSFCHHGDHHLCLGVHLNHLFHIDFHPMGYEYCRNNLGLDNRYLPLTFEDKHCSFTKTDFMLGGKLITATAARSNKIEIPYYVSYLDIVPRILKATGGRHVHIGTLTPWALFRIYRQMKRLGVKKDQFVYIKWTSSVWKTLQDLKVDVYLASFPYGAGLTVIEAMGAGIPVIMHEHMYSRVLSGIELAYAEAYRWSNPSDLTKHLTNLKPSRIMHEKILARHQYERFHKKEVLSAYLNDPLSLDLPAPKYANDFNSRLDEWAAVTEQQISFKHLIYRRFYRFFRSIRSGIWLKLRQLFHNTLE